MTAPEITDHDDQAADLARHEADTARTENTRAVDAAGKLITALGALGAVGGTLGTLAIKGHAYVGGALLLAAGLGMFLAFDRAVSVIQARIPAPEQTSPGWLALLAVPREQWTQHYRQRAADLITAYAAENDVIGRTAYRKHRSNRTTAVLIRCALALGGVGAVFVILGI